jgi:predicted polyphosphate/ATP-dependent NAD kinase
VDATSKNIAASILRIGADGVVRDVFDAIRKDAPVVGGCREKSYDNRFNVPALNPTRGATE